MSGEPQLFRVNPGSSESERIQSVDFRELALRERQDIQEWVAANPDILEDNLLVVCKEFSGFDRTNERLDLLAVDSDGKLVVIELKRDDTGADAHWQAIKYASYLRRTSGDEIVEILANYADISWDDACDRLVRHLGGDDLNALNNDQRIILASHRFAPEVTSAALWLNEKAPGENLITCVTLTPYQMDGTVYIQASTIIPVPGVEDYLIFIGSKGDGQFREKRRPAVRAREQNDEVTAFVVSVCDLVQQNLSDVLSPDRRSNWALTYHHLRYCNLWYTRPLHGAITGCATHSTSSHKALTQWLALVFLKDVKRFLPYDLRDLSIHQGQWQGSKAVVGTDRLNNVFAERIASVLGKFIAEITPRVDNHDEGFTEVKIESETNGSTLPPVPGLTGEAR